VLASFFGMRNSFFIGSSVLFLICLITVLFIKEPPKSEETNVKEKNTVTYFSLLKQKNILILLVCVCLTNMVILQIQPIVALYVEQLTNGAENSVMLSGLVLSLGALSGAIASPIWGRTGQKKGFARTLCLALIIAGFMIAIQGIPDNLELFALIQFICGLGFSGIFPSANSILVLFTPSSSRGTGFGLLFSAQMVGGAIGPLLGGIVVTILSFKAVYALSGSMLLIAGLYLLLFAPKSFKQKANSTQSVNRTDAKEHIESIKSKFILDNSKDKTVK
ncbi:MAG: MFS transporter, partial [Succinivibrio sp.]